MKALDWARAFVRRHKHAEEVAAEAVGVNVLTRLVATALAAGAASAAITVVATQQSSVYHPGYSLSVKGAAFLTRNEGVRYAPYNDPYNCTVGVGHLIHYGACTASDYSRWRITGAQANTLLVADSGSAAGCVRDAVTRPISQPQFDALVDLTFNAGCGSLDYRGVRAAIDSGDLASVPSRLATTAVTANGVYLPGLHTRRLAEGALFAKGYYGAGIGYWLPPRPLTAAEKRRLALRAKTGYWNWLAWRLGEKPWNGLAPANPKARPHVPARVPAVWWADARAFLRARHA